MKPSGATVIEECASRFGGQLMEQWGRLAVTLIDDLDLDRICESVEGHNLLMIGRFGENSEVEIVLSAETPSSRDLHTLQSIVATESERLALLNPVDGWTAAKHARSALAEIEMRYDHSNWCPSLESLRRIVRTDWMMIADTLVDEDVTVGSITIPLRRVDGTAALTILEPLHDRPETEGSEQETWDILASIADATAWREIAIGEKRTEGGLKVALHRDQPMIVDLDPGNASGGAALWKWLHATEDANREEALRYILRLVTATVSQMPNSASVLALAEHYRIALTQDQAAEVHRAVSDGRALIRKGLQDSRRTLSDYTEDTVKTTQAAVIAGIGVVALVARNAATLPDWLLGMVTAVAILGVLALICNRWLRIGELGSDIEALESALSEDKAPLLPAHERVELKEELRHFDAVRRVKAGRMIVVSLGCIAISVILAAGIWIIHHDSSPGANGNEGDLVERSENSDE